MGEDEVSVFHNLMVNCTLKLGFARVITKERYISANDMEMKAVRLDDHESNTPAKRMYNTFAFQKRDIQKLCARNTRGISFF